MSSHVGLVGVLFIIWGILTALIGLSTLALAVAGASIMASASHSGAHVAAGLTVAAFLTLGGIAIVWGLAHVAVGVPLRRRHHAARVMALTLGAVDLVLVPYGTALGCYTLWVLLNERGKQQFL